MLEKISKWAMGDAKQGKLMVFFGLILLIVFLFILRTDVPFYRGALIPMAFTMLVLLAYGGFLAFSRIGHMQKMIQLYENSPKEALALEYKKAAVDHRNYSVMKKVWPVLMLLALLAFSFLKTDYSKGTAIGFIFLSFAGFMIDSYLHQRLIPYWAYLKKQVED